MTDHDEELQKLLRRWDAPPVSSNLDARISQAVSRAPRSRWRSFTIAAGVFLALAGLAAMHLGSRPPRRTQVETRVIETRVDATGFRPVPNGSITVVEKGNNQ
jgi:hypothetical protein